MKTITVNELRQMNNAEGLILQGCGGDLNEWVDGINKIFQKNGILSKGAVFKNVYVLENNECTNLLFSFENIKLEIGKLAVWRIATQEQLQGIWLSDYLVNQFSGEENYCFDSREKPDCELIGQNGNIFNLLGIASRTLKKHGQKEQAAEMFERVTGSKSYEQALNIIGEYVNIVSAKEVQVQEGGINDFLGI